MYSVIFDTSLGTQYVSKASNNNNNNSNKLKLGFHPVALIRLEKRTVKYVANFCTTY
jgi:hypothetical protein